MVQINKETANIGEYKVDNNANVANFVHLQKTRSVWRIEAKGVEVKSTGKSIKPARIILADLKLRLKRLFSDLILIAWYRWL